MMTTSSGRWAVVELPNVVCPIPGNISHDDARSMFNKVRNEMPRLTQAAWRREAARRMGVDYDDFLKAWKKPTKTPVKPSPITTPVTPRPVLPAPAPKPSPSPPVVVLDPDTARAQFKLVKKEHPDWTDAQVRREAASRMNVEYDEFLRAWKKGKGSRNTTRTPRVTVPPDRLVRPQPPKQLTWQKKKAVTSGIADARAVNPGRWGPGGKRSGAEYWNNCTSCTTSYELRRRGYDVVARLTPKGQPLRYVYESWGDDIWGKQITSKAQSSLAGHRGVLAGTDKYTFMDVVDESMPIGARGFITVVWKHGGSHIYNWEVREGVGGQAGKKKLWFVDAQSGSEWPVEQDTYLSRAEQQIYVARVDELSDPPKAGWLTSPVESGQVAIGRPLGG